MPSFAGTSQFLAAQGSPSQPCLCRLDFDEKTFTLVFGDGPPLACDLGDIDEFAPAEYELRLRLYTGDQILLSRFGKAFQNLCHDLLKSYRKRLVQCLLLNDLEEIERFEGHAELLSPEGGFSAPAEIRLYQSNLAVLPQGCTGIQWRLAEIDSASFDDARYAIAVQAGEETLLLGRLAKRTGELRERLQSAVTEIAGKSAQTIRSVFPFLNPEQLRRAAEFLKEGRVAPMSHLVSIHPGTERALVDTVVKSRLKPSFEYLAARTAPGWLYAGFKLIRKEEETEPDTDPEALPALPPEVEEELEGVEPDASEEEGDTEVLHWFLFPLLAAGGSGVPEIVAWETTSRSGRATYFFRLRGREDAPFPSDPAQAAAAIDKAVRRLNRGLLLLNFRREPIYLSDSTLEMQSRYRRYAIACRKLSAVRFLRASFLGRALHTSTQAWQQQVERIMSAWI